VAGFGFLVIGDNGDVNPISEEEVGFLKRQVIFDSLLDLRVITSR
jgi:hypothetical protein